MTAAGSDDLLGRIERRTWLVGALAIGAALMVPSGGRWFAASVASGLLLSVVSYWTIKRGIDGLTDAVRASAVPDPDASGAGEGDRARDDTAGAGAPGDARNGTGRRPRGLGWLLLRYALLAGMAYVMIARLRLSPIGLLCGASTTVVAAAAEVVRRPR